MAKVKKIIGLLLAVVLILSMGITSFAANDEKMEVSITSATIKAKGTATVSVVVPDDFDAWMAQFTIKYDASKLEVVSVSREIAENAEINTYFPGYIYFAWDVEDVESDNPVEKGGVLFNIEFAAVEGTEAQDVAVEFDLNDEVLFGDKDFNVIPVETKNGTVTIIDVIYGDVDGNGNINVFDANLICRAAIGLIVLDDSQKAAADVDGNGNINVFDANYVCRYAIGLITKFPVE